MDPVYVEAERVYDSIALKRAEFNQLEKEYMLTLHPAHLIRMEELTKLVRIELEIAHYLQKNYRYYHKGLDKKRWQINQQIYSLCRTSICQMLLARGELEMLYNDQEKASAIFKDLITEFGDGNYDDYVGLAKSRLLELAHRPDHYTASEKNVPVNEQRNL